MKERSQNGRLVSEKVFPMTMTDKEIVIVKQLKCLPEEMSFLGDVSLYLFCLRRDLEAYKLWKKLQTQ